MKWLIFCIFLLFVANSVLAQNTTAEKIAKLLPLFIKDQQIGMFMADGLDKQYGLANDPENLSRIQRIGNEIVAVTNHPNAKYDFQILASNDFNACSVYGGKVRVFQGLINDTRNSDDELADVLAHEIAHNEIGHNKAAVKTFKTAYALDLFKVTNRAPQLLLAAANAVLAKRSRKFETEADKQALSWMAKAGYNPTGAIAVFRRIEAEHNLEKKNSNNNALSGRFAQIFATHPEPASRVAMAEDFLFEQKYGRTFKMVAGESTSDILSSSTTTNSIAKGLPVIAAHPSQWETPITETTNITGMGLFNPSSIIKEKQEVNFYLDILLRGHIIVITADNDFHNPGKIKYKDFEIEVRDQGDLSIKNLISDYNHTFICAPSLDKNSLIEAIKKGKTYASALGIKIENANFSISQDYPKVQKACLRFSLNLPIYIVNAPIVKIFRNGQEVASMRKKNILERQPNYIFEDKNLQSGRYFYNLYIPKLLMTSPITIEVTNNEKDPTDLSWDNQNWHKGIVHGHSDHSDGGLTLAQIWQKKGDNQFVFMTDHNNAFDKTKYEKYVKECQDISPLLIPGIEYSLTGGKLRHLLILGVYDYIAQKEINEEDFFGTKTPDKLQILPGPVHLGDDQKDSEIHKDAVFNYGQTEATLKLRVKGTPRKDPIIWVNRIEIGRITTTDDQWHWYEFKIPKSDLRSGQNLFHIQSYIPDRWQTFDDCEVADVYILKN